MKHHQNALNPAEPDHEAGVRPEHLLPAACASVECGRTLLQERLQACQLELRATSEALHRANAALLASRNRQTERILREQTEIFRQIAENLSDFIAVLDRDGRRIYNSPSYERLFGPPGELRNTDSFAEVHPADQERIKQVFRETIQTGQGQQIEYRFVLADGTIRHMESRGSVIRDGEGRVARVLVVAQDVTERVLLQEKIRDMAFHDHLTGLPNRHLFNDRLRQALEACARHSCHGALMFIDLDNFKPLNDTYGHEVGDLFLVEVAGRLRTGLRTVDTVARFGGDEFVVMLNQLDPDKFASRAHAQGIAEKLLATLSEPYSLPGLHATGAATAVEHRCSASIGVALFDDAEMTPAEILKRADRAMYRAKRAGGNQVLFLDVERGRDTKFTQILTSGAPKSS